MGVNSHSKPKLKCCETRVEINPNGQIVKYDEYKENRYVMQKSKPLA